MGGRGAPMGRSALIGGQVAAHDSVRCVGVLVRR
jgi:hypothetical protein